MHRVHRLRRYDPGANSALDPLNQYLYKIGGQPTVLNRNDVWQSTNGGVSWRNMAETARLPHTAGFYPAVTVNSLGHVIEATGGNLSFFGNDVVSRPTHPGGAAAVQSNLCKYRSLS